MQLRKKSSRSLRRKYVSEKDDILKGWSVKPADVYMSIKTLVLQKWWDIQETNDFSILSKEKQPKTLYKFLSYCSDVWDEIRQQQLDAFGVPENFSEYLKAIANLADKQLQYAITNDGADKMDLRMAETDLKAIIGEPSQNSQKENLKTKRKIEIALKMNFPIDPNTTVVMQYYTDFELAQETSSYGK